MSDADEELEDGGGLYTQVPDDLMLDTSISAEAVRLWIWIKSHARKKRVAWPGIAGAQDAFGWPERSTKRRMAELVDAGWVKRRRRMGASTRTFLCSTKGQRAPWEEPTGQPSAPVGATSGPNDQATSGLNVEATHGPSKRPPMAPRSGHLVAREPEELTRRTEPEGGRASTTSTASTSPPPTRPPLALVDIQNGSQLADWFADLIAKHHPKRPRARITPAHREAGQRMLDDLTRRTDDPSGALAEFGQVAEWAVSESSWWTRKVRSIRDLPGRYEEIHADWCGAQVKAAQAAAKQPDSIEEQVARIERNQAERAARIARAS